MSQHDFNIANQSFPATRTDLNNALQALASNSSGDAEPSTTFANQWWYETDTNTLKLRNEANNAWLSFATVDQTTAAWTLAHDVDITGTLTATALVGDITGDVTGNLTGNVTGNINGLTPQASNMQPFNRIINGAMTIDQRNAGAAVTGGVLVHTVDRFVSFVDTDGVMTFQQVSDAPTGFKYSLKATATTADASLSATQRAAIFQRIEGYNVTDFMLGSANAVQFTASFWVKSTLTGTFGGSFQNNSSNRAYPFTYTISVADTWEQKSVTITGDTTGTWETTTATGLQIAWGLGVGSTYSGTAGAWAAADYNSATGGTSVIGTLNATWQVTGVQLEAGSTASSFAHEDYGTTLRKCQRYYYRIKATGINYPFELGQCFSTTLAGALIPFPVTMRIAPSALEQSGTATDYQLYQASGSVQTCSSVPVYASILTTPATGAVNWTVTSNIVSGNVTTAAAATSSAYLAWSAEL